MNRRYVIAGGAVVAVAGLWYMYMGSSGGGSAPAASSAAASSAAGATSTPSATVTALPTSQLYGNTTASAPPAGSGMLSSLDAFGRPRDAFVQMVSSSASTAGSNSLTFGSTSTSSTKTAPISLGSGTTSAVPSGSSQTPTTGSGSGTSTTSTTPTTAPSLQTLAAEFDINGQPVVAYDGDMIPPDTQQFTVRSMTMSQVVLGLNGALLANGASSVTIKVGKSVTLEDQTAHTSVVVHLLNVHAA